MTDETAPAPKLRRAPAEKAARAVLPACAGMWTAAEIMHVTGVPWLDITLGGAAGCGVVYGKWGQRAAIWTGVAAAWAVLASRLGPAAGPYLAVTDAWAVLSFCGWRLARRHPAVLDAIGKRNAAADWLAKRARWGLDRTHLLDWEETRLGERYVLDVRGTGKRASAIAHSDVAERIAENQPSPLPPSRVRVRKHRLAGRIEISIRTVDPWAHPIPHPVVTEDHELDLSGPYSIRRPAVIGQDPETGTPLELLLCGDGGGRNVNVVATIEGGKTVLLACISERVTAASDALLFRINLSIKGDNERTMWGPACHLTALGPREGTRALHVLRVLSRIIEYRAAQPKAGANWVPSPRDPHLVLIIDEIDALTGIPACRQLLERLASKGREFGFTAVRAGQRGTAEWTGGGNVRAVDGVFCIGKVNRSMEAMHAAGDLGLSLPNMAEYGEGRPGVWAVADLADSAHRAGRSFNLADPDDIRGIVAERAPLQPDLQPELKAFLGESYEKLLSTDVYARWARSQGKREVIAHPRPDMAPEGHPDSADAASVLAVANTIADVALHGDAETKAAWLGALHEANQNQASLEALDAEAEEHMTSLGPEDDLRRRWLDQGKRNDETRRVLAETAAEPLPDIPREQLTAHAAERWRQVGEGTVIPDEHREPLLRLLTAGTTIRAVAETLQVTKWAARTYLERLRTEGLVRMEGDRRTARWLLAAPEEGDAS